MCDETRTRYGFPQSAFDPSTIPDFDAQYLSEADIEQFARALNAPESSPVVALNDWRPVTQRVKRKRQKKAKKPQRTTDETREGIIYTLLKWPLLLAVFGWILLLTSSYLLTRTYIWGYERWITWRGERQRLRRDLRSKTNYKDWRMAAQKLDAHLGNTKWRDTNEYAYYDHMTVMKVKDQLKAARTLAENQNQRQGKTYGQAVSDLRSLVEACVKNNFVGVENPRLYSETYYGTKHLVQEFIDELHESLVYLLYSSQLSQLEKYTFAKHLNANFGRTALCLSGGAGFVYYHLGVSRALLTESLLPDVVTGTSGGALVAALLATRTNDELQDLLVPALAHRINACQDGIITWAPRWYYSGARFDSLEWAQHCAFFTRGNTTFREAYERTGRILNISCIPSNPYAPVLLLSVRNAPDAVIWSAVLASAAVPGILNPIVLMMKSPDGNLLPYSFGHKWKDGSLRTDIPLQALNRHFGVNFSIVSQVNPHINLFFFSSRGAVGRPVTHRRGRGWRGGFLGSAVEKYIQLELQKFLKISRHLELLPRPLGQDWSGIWLQNFSGTVTIWPKAIPSDFAHILSDPTPLRLARMLLVGQQSTFPKLLFIQNRMKIERLIDEGLQLGHLAQLNGDGSVAGDLAHPHKRGRVIRCPGEADADEEFQQELPNREDRRPSVIQEIRHQTRVFFDDSEVDHEETGGSEDETAVSAIQRDE